MKPKNLSLSGGRATECFTFNNGQSFCNDSGSMDRYRLIHSGWPVIKGDHKKPLPHRYEYSVSHGRSSNYRRYSSYSSMWSAGTADARDLPLDDTTTAYNNALSDLVEKVRGGLDLSVDAFQSRQTGRMFNVASQVEDLARGLRRSGIGKLKLIGSLWLQFQYGWLPTLSSVYGIADETLRYVLNNLSTYRGQSVMTSSSVDSVYDTRGLFPVRALCQRKTQVKIAVTVNNSKVINLSRWTSLNPISIGWEILPFSFVVDWVFDVGSFLRTAETALLYGRAFESGYVSTYSESRGSGVRTSTPSGFTIFEGEVARVRFDRRVLTSFPFPQKPKLNFNLSSQRLLNAAGLLSQFLR